MTNVRLGYACINMTLGSRPNKLGGRVYTSRTARKATWQSTNDLDLLGSKALANAHDLLHILKWNVEHDIYLFRIGSEVFPWHDHYELCDLPQYDEIAAQLHICGEYARSNNMRLTTHPGPFHVLGSPKDHVIDSSIIGLERHSQMFDLMGYTPSYDNAINIHMGGAYGDHDSTAKRWITAWHRLSDRCKARLVIENDDKPSMWSTQMLYDYLYPHINIPITFDYHHHRFHTSGLSEQEALELAGSTWPSHIRQLTHYSESKSAEYDDPKIRPQAHSDYIRQEIDTYNHPLDIMIEAKAKELALLEYRNIYTHKKVLTW